MTCQKHAREMQQATRAPMICAWCLCDCNRKIYEYITPTSKKSWNSEGAPRDWLTCGMGCWLVIGHTPKIVKIIFDYSVRVRL
jgi:hypothetical protein